MSRRLLVPLLLALAGCGSHAAAFASPMRAADGSWRLESSAGSFATWNTSFPAELEAVVRGEASSSDVWALEDGSLDYPSQQRR